MGGERLEEHSALVALLRERPDGISWPEIMAETLEIGSAVQVWDRRRQPALLDLAADGDPIARARSDLTGWAGEGTIVVTVLDPEYPVRLRGVHQAPPILFARGALAAQDRAVSVVGSRKASGRGLAIAGSIARALVTEGITVLSGLAEGIDTAAHRAALDTGGRTVAVIGTGIGRYYPPRNRELQDMIAADGLVLSQFWPDSPPSRASFPMRNATMSGYGLATVVVEAGEKSGARIQARVAVGHGRPVILTDLVVDANQWAKTLLDRPGVHRAAGLDEVMQILHDLDDGRDAATAAVRALLPA
jgi:DNA processing protein